LAEASELRNMPLKFNNFSIIYRTKGSVKLIKSIEDMGGDAPDEVWVSGVPFDERTNLMAEGLQELKKHIGAERINVGTPGAALPMPVKLSDDPAPKKKD